MLGMIPFGAALIIGLIYSQEGAGIAIPASIITFAIVAML